MNEMWEGSIVCHNCEVSDAIECIDAASKADIIVRMGVHDGVNGVNDGFSTTG